MLQDKVIGIYCLIDDILKGIGHYEKGQRKVSDSEIITTALISTLYFKGNQSQAADYMRTHNMMPRMIGKSGFTKRLHQVQPLVTWLFEEMGRLFKYICCEMEYIIDSFPLKVCHNIRIRRSKLFGAAEELRGYNASKKEYFYGIKVQLITTKEGIPVELCFVPGSEHDVHALSRMSFDLPAMSRLYADSAYTDYGREDLYKETEKIELMVSRKSNSKRADEPWMAFLKTAMRKRIETAISEIVELMPHSIHAVTPNGFLLKVLLFVFAYQLKTII